MLLKCERCAHFCEILYRCFFFFVIVHKKQNVNEWKRSGWRRVSVSLSDLCTPHWARCYWAKSGGLPKECWMITGEGLACVLSVFNMMNGSWNFYADPRPLSERKRESEWHMMNCKNHLAFLTVTSHNIKGGLNDVTKFATLEYAHV